MKRRSSVRRLAVALVSFLVVLAASKSASANTEVMVFFDAEDFTSDRANDTIRDLANLCTEEGVRAQFALAVLDVALQ